MEFVNLTPHVITVLDMEGTHLRDLQPSGAVARCSSSEEVFASVDGVPLLRQSFGAVEGLPEPREGVLLVVSRLVAAALPERDDLLCPGPLVRGADGQPVGCRGLSRV